VLVVDDDPFACDLLVDQLEVAGYDAVAVKDGRKALESLRRDPPDVCVLDIDLPGLDGLSILQHLRTSGMDLGVIMLTGRAGELDRVRGLRSGADDYLGKPFLPAELVARVEALVRRLRGSSDGTVRLGDLELDHGGRSVRWRGADVELTRTEFDLLAELARTPGRVVSRADLLVQVWDLPPEWKADATLTEHVHRVRSKLPGIAISTVRGVGYRLDCRRGASDLDAVSTS
jgi:DNA-binding response OmpR family regulator